MAVARLLSCRISWPYAEAGEEGCLAIGIIPLERALRGLAEEIRERLRWAVHHIVWATRGLATETWSCQAGWYLCHPISAIRAESSKREGVPFEQLHDANNQLRETAVEERYAEDLLLERYLAINRIEVRGTDRLGPGARCIVVRDTDRLRPGATVPLHAAPKRLSFLQAQPRTSPSRRT